MLLLAWLALRAGVQPHARQARRTGVMPRASRALRAEMMLHVHRALLAGMPVILFFAFGKSVWIVILVVLVTHLPDLLAFLWSRNALVNPCVEQFACRSYESECEHAMYQQV